MRSNRSDGDRKTYFCDAPWTGAFSVQTNLDVLFCPCYLQMKIGNLDESSMQEIWNSEQLVEIRRSFSRGELAKPCIGQLCPVALGKDPLASA
jgi:radical SAM protein with 4Fe4S-binding SPASM domain